MITDQIKSIDIVAVIQSCGVELHHIGNKYIGLCPLHDERNPSFYAYPESKKFKCYGCGEYGDVVDFLQKMNGWDFKQALQRLGIATGPLSEEDKKIIEVNRKKKEAERRYQQRESEIAFTLGTLIRWTYAAMSTINTEVDMEEFFACYHALPFWEHCHDVLCQGDHQERRQVVEALKDMEIIKRNPLFRADFNFSGWLREFINGVPQNEPHRIKISIS